MLEAMPIVSTNSRAWVDRALRTMFPPCCIFCGTEVAQRHACCAACATGIHVLGAHQCKRCGRPLSADLAPGPCGHCLHKPPPQEQTLSLYAYDGPVREAILNWKLQGRDTGLAWLLDAAERRLQKIFTREDLLLPVPMPLKRMRKSGQHHAADLCRYIARLSGSRVDWLLLRRSGEQPRQSALSGGMRRRNLSRAFLLDKDRWRCIQPPGRIWLLDDILTTGATIQYACRCLKKTGQPVHAFTLARVLR